MGSTFNAVQGKRRTRTVTVVYVVFLCLGLLLTLLGARLLFIEESNQNVDLFVGVDVAYGDENEVYAVANAVSGYANLIIVGSLTVTNNTAKLTRVCDYLYQRGFYFIVYVGFASVGYLPPRGPAQGFFNTAVDRWAGKFLGA